MKSSVPTRVNYFDRQFLRRNEFADEQSYQIDQRRRHNISHHSWGIVTGLELVLEEGKLVVRPGLAVDGYGRELVLSAKKIVSVDEFTRLASNTLDVWLFYENTENSDAPKGYISCTESEATPNYRTSEVPRLFFERARGGKVDARRPRGVPPGILDSASQLRTVDDPLVVWPIYLGRITFVETEKDPLKQFIVDGSSRPYAGLVAETIDHPAQATRLMLGPTPSGDKRRVGDTVYTYMTTGSEVGVYVSPDAATSDQVTLEPRFSISQNGKNFLKGSTGIQGNLQLVGGALQFTEPTPIADVTSVNDPSVYRVHDAAGDELRIDLGAEEKAKNRKFVIGFSASDGSFRPAVTIQYLEHVGVEKPQPLVTIEGDLTLNGLVKVNDIIRRSLTEETLNALLSSFQAGVIAAGGQ